MKEWMFRTIGNCLYRVNGGLEGLEKDNRMHRWMIWAWSLAWYAEEKAAGRIPIER